MVRNNNPLKVIGATTLSEMYRAIVIDASNSFTVTLSSITHNGVDYIISRIDTSLPFVVTLYASSGVIFDTSTNSSTTYIIPINTLLEIISYDGDWYIIRSINLNLKLFVGILSKTFVSNNNSSFLVITGGDPSNPVNITSVIRFIHNYSISPVFSGIIVSLTKINGNLTGNLQVVSLGTGVEVIFISLYLTTPETIGDYTAYASNSQFVGNVDTIIIRFVPTLGTNGNDIFGINSLSLF